MSKVTYAGFEIKGIAQGALYKARIVRGDGAQSNCSAIQRWETSRYLDAKTAVEQAISLINTVRLTGPTAWSPFATEFNRLEYMGDHNNIRAGH